MRVKNRAGKQIFFIGPPGLIFLLTIESFWGYNTPPGRKKRFFSGQLTNKQVANSPVLCFNLIVLSAENFVKKTFGVLERLLKHIGN